MQHRRKALPALCAAAALAAPAVAHADTTLTFKEANKGSTFHFIDNPPKAGKSHRPSAGDQFVVTEPLVDSSGKHIGRLQAQCTVTKPGKTDSTTSAICFGVFSFANGTLDAMVAESNLNAKATKGGIIGGTGTYAGARGTFVSKTTKTGNGDTVDLLG